MGAIGVTSKDTECSPERQVTLARPAEVVWSLIPPDGEDQPSGRVKRQAYDRRLCFGEPGESGDGEKRHTEESRREHAVEVERVCHG